MATVPARVIREITATFIACRDPRCVLFVSVWGFAVGQSKSNQMINKQIEFIEVFCIVLRLGEYRGTIAAKSRDYCDASSPSRLPSRKVSFAHVCARFADRSVAGFVQWSVGWLVGGLVGWWVGRLVDRSVPPRSVCSSVGGRLVGLLPFRSVGAAVGRSVAWSVGRLAVPTVRRSVGLWEDESTGRLPVRAVGWSVGASLGQSPLVRQRLVLLDATSARARFRAPWNVKSKSIHHINTNNNKCTRRNITINT